MIEQLSTCLRTTRAIQLPAETYSQDAVTLKTLQHVSQALKDCGHIREADRLSEVFQLCQTSPNFGGLGLSPDDKLSTKQQDEILLLVSAWLEALNSEDRSKSPLKPLTSRPPGRRPMTLAEKIFAFHDVERRGWVKPGQTIRVDVDWIMASEASWGSMEQTYNKLGKPGIFRNDRFWIAGDHVVDPRVNHLPQISRLIESSEKARKLFKMTDYQGMNYTIMHTEFFRERAQPGMLVIGSDSHTCSSGALGCLSIGLGAADVTLPLVTGETFFQVPECVNIRLVGAPRPGVSGKDVILYILQQLKRNTVAAERVVEFTGPGVKHLSCDARFAISNMTTEFGGITGVFVPDQNTYDFVNARKSPRHKKNSHYFRPDDDAEYAATHQIDLSHVESFVAVYPKPDDVAPVTQVEGQHLDGCFIGACTTAEEDLILGALVLEQGLKDGLTPVGTGKRKVVPGSRPILDKLRKTGLADIYEECGFEVGIPGCSYCVGMSADKASEGEVWLSSQNRNFENRMGKGSIGNLASAATVAASSFHMSITNPQSLVEQVDVQRWDKLRRRGPRTYVAAEEPIYVEPPSSNAADEDPAIAIDEESITNPTTERNTPREEVNDQSNRLIQGKINQLGDFVDTDALAPAQYLITCHTPEEIGAHCLEFTNPDFRDRVKNGFNIVVAGKAFGCGSSREQAVLALLGCGVQAVIAKSFAFIYARNQPSLGLLGITITDEAFYDAAADGTPISIDLAKTVVVAGDQEWTFELSHMEKELIAVGGITQAFAKFGKTLFEVMCGSSKVSSARRPRVESGGDCGDTVASLKW